MKKRNLAIWVVLGMVLLGIVSCEGGNKYSFLLENADIKKVVEKYNSTIKTDSTLMDYANVIVDSPQNLYKILVESECDPEILSFVKNNKDLTLALVHFNILTTAINSGVTKDNEFIIVANYVKSPNGLGAATNQMELGMEKTFMREMTAYKLYEMFTEPGGMKKRVEEMFHSMEQSRNIK